MRGFIVASCILSALAISDNKDSSNTIGSALIPEVDNHVGTPAGETQGSTESTTQSELVSVDSAEDTLGGLKIDQASIEVNGAFVQFAADVSRPLCNQVTEWSTWTACNKTCGSGFRQRYRLPIENKGVSAIENTAVFKNCGVCPNDFPNPYLYGERCCNGNTGIQDKPLEFTSERCTGNVVECKAATNSGTCRSKNFFLETDVCNTHACAPEETGVPVAAVTLHMIPKGDSAFSVAAGVAIAATLLAVRL